MGRVLGRVIIYGRGGTWLYDGRGGGGLRLVLRLAWVRPVLSLFDIVWSCTEILCMKVLLSPYSTMRFLYFAIGYSAFRCYIRKHIYVILNSRSLLFLIIHCFIAFTE